MASLKHKKKSGSVKDGLKKSKKESRGNGDAPTTGVAPQALVSSISAFLSEHGFHGASKTLEKEQKIAIDKGTVTPTTGDVPSLLDLFQSWEARNSGPVTEESAATSDSSSEDEDTSDSDSASDSDGSDGSESSASNSDSESESGSGSESDVSMKDAKPIASKKRNRSRSPSSDSTSSSSDSEASDEADDKPLPAPAKAATLKRKAESTSSESDEETSTVKKAKIMEESEDSMSDSESSAESSSDDSDSSDSGSSDSGESSSGVSEAEAESDSSSASGSDSDSDSSPDQIRNELKNEAKFLKTAAKTPLPASSDDSETSGSDESDDTSAASEDAKVSKTEPLSRKSSTDTTGTLDVGSPTAANPTAQPDQDGIRKKHNGARPTPLAVASELPHDHPSNAYISYAYAERAHQDLSITRGKGFTKEKNKKKRGSYRGGPIDIGPSRYSFKFDD